VEDPLNAPVTKTAPFTVAPYELYGARIQSQGAHSVVGEQGETGVSDAEEIGNALNNSSPSDWAADRQDHPIQKVAAILAASASHGKQILTCPCAA
jgi:hypothetical protein